MYSYGQGQGILLIEQVWKVFFPDSSKRLSCISIGLSILFHAWGSSWYWYKHVYLFTILL